MYRGQSKESEIRYMYRRNWMVFALIIIGIVTYLALPIIHNYTQEVPLESGNIQHAIETGQYR